MRIETDRLILRPFTENDAADAYEYLKAPMVNCFACMKLNSLEEAQAEMQKRAEDTELYFAIVLKETGKVIGEINAHPEATAPDENAQQDTFSPCWMLNKDYHGKGYAYEAAKAFFDYLFNEKGARRISSGIISRHSSGGMASSTASSWKPAFRRPIRICVSVW